jgi:hypothetical protein
MLQLKFRNSALSGMSASVEKRRAVVLYSKMFKIEYRAVIKFLTKEGKSPAEIIQSLDAVYGETSLSYSTVKEWAKQFRLGRETIEDDLQQHSLLKQLLWCKKNVTG